MSLTGYQNNVSKLYKNKTNSPELHQEGISYLILDSYVQISVTCTGRWSWSFKWKLDNHDQLECNSKSLMFELNVCFEIVFEF